MVFKNVFSENSSMHYVNDQLQVTSGIGRSCLMNMPFMTDAEALRHELDLVQNMLDLLKQEGSQDFFRGIHEQFCQLNDIRPTVALMNGNTVFDDIQLFEIKKTAIISRRVAEVLKSFSCMDFPLEEMSELIEILDPEHTGIPHFYVYSAYSEKLRDLREQMRQTEDADEQERLRFQAEGEEDIVRAELSYKIGRFKDSLSRNLDTLAHLDVIVAKAQLAHQWHACRPVIADATSFSQLRNPQVDEVLHDQGKQFQPLDIAFGRETVLITGANMAGKSVLLKTLSMAQYLMQFGFFIPAEKAEMVIVDEVISSIGDNQSELSGLSSFAVEILTIDRIVKTAKKGVRVLALVDELARTTNPEEGKRLVNGFIKMAQELSITAIVTTHYSGIHVTCRRLRVRGLKLDGKPTITARNIGNYMDYSLVETTDDEVPKEALTIAELLDVDADFIRKAREN
ncbi:MAG: DNA mismatch repair protein MutS [Bacteroidales bacterium]|nr:DNA mismatch repair protein MutS [Bacteroidales bacterium]